MNLRRLGDELNELSLHLRKYRRTIPGRSSEASPPDFIGEEWPEDAVPYLWNAEIVNGPAPLTPEPTIFSSESEV